MGVLVVLLVVTNFVTLGVVGWLVLRPAGSDEPDTVVAAGLDAAPRPAAAVGGTRRVISIEILNPIELAGTRSRMAGIAGSLVPGLTRRVVHERALKQIRRDIREQGVVADVRLHVIKPAPAEPRVTVVEHPAPSATPRSSSTAAPPTSASERPPLSIDEIYELNFDELEDRGA